MTSTKLITGISLSIPTRHQITSRGFFRDVFGVTGAASRISPATTEIPPALAAFLSSMLAHCTLELRVTAFSPEHWPKAHSLRRQMPPSLQRRTKLIDRLDTIWRSVCDYLRPIASEITARPRRVDPTFRLDEIAWGLYLTVLASKECGETAVDPEKLVTWCKHLGATHKLSGESAARLAIITGLFSEFEAAGARIPILQFAPRASSESIVRRVDDILDDSYLCEASFLRRTLSLQSNIAAVRRDLRLLLDAIVRRRWARDIVVRGTSAVFPGARAADAVGDAIGQIFEPAAPTHAFPILSPTRQLARSGSTAIVQIRRLMNDTRGFAMIEWPRGGTVGFSL